MKTAACFALAALVAACAADVAPETDPFCDGTTYREYCSWPGAPASYGMSTACLGTPYLRDPAGDPVSRPEGREGCQVRATFGLLCCP
jgi:hypothetical protein